MQTILSHIFNQSQKISYIFGSSENVEEVKFFIYVSNSLEIQEENSIRDKNGWYEWFSISYEHGQKRLGI